MKDNELASYYYLLESLEQDLVELSMKYSDDLPNHIIRAIKDLNNFSVEEMKRIELQLRKNFR